ncbi:MAG: hypothetical protein ACLSG9_10550 [Eubacterium sp.]
MKKLLVRSFCRRCCSTVVASQTIIRDCVESALKKMAFSQEEIHGFLEDLMKENQNDFVVDT